MCVNGPVLRSVVVALLLSLSCGKRSCNFKEILGSYRGIILVELQNLNLTGSFDTSKERDHCPSGKTHHILRSIYGMTQQFRCQRGDRRQGELGRPVGRMEQLISHNCRQDFLVKRACPARQKTRRKKRSRIKLIKLVRAIINCWQKLQSMYTLPN